MVDKCVQLRHLVMKILHQNWSKCADVRLKLVTIVKLLTGTIMDIVGPGMKRCLEGVILVDADTFPYGHMRVDHGFVEKRLKVSLINLQVLRKNVEQSLIEEQEVVELVVLNCQCMIVAGVDGSDICVVGMRHFNNRAVDILACRSNGGNKWVMVICIP